MLLAGAAVAAGAAARRRRRCLAGISPSETAALADDRGDP
jgi:hypothetical protein